ncbi:MAG TPA: heavy metal translocating P-type ATPase [Phycisphaerales bacterium]|nr:heavy metal translocating P-type ATPase [Phycisphaerales bacterium]
MSTNSAAPPRISASVACTHCSLAVPAGLIEPDAEHQFCCTACATAYSLIHSCGLDAYYRLRAATETDKAPAKATGKRFSEFDDPTFTSLYTKPLAHLQGGYRTARLMLQNLHCAACVWLIEKLPSIVPGVIESRLDFRRGTVDLTWDPSLTHLSRIAQALDSLGYTPHPSKDGEAQSLRTIEDRRFMKKLAVAGACAGNVMLLAFALYAGAFDTMQSSYEQTFRWLSLVLGLVSLLGPGRLFFKNAWAAVRTRTPHLDLPITLALLSGGVFGTINVIRGHGEIYFDALTVLVFLLLVGRFFQARQQRWAVDSIELLFSLTPTSARRLKDSAATEVPIESLIRGDLVEVRAGDSIPADGVVVSGASKVDQSLLSGESRPVTVAEGDHVAAGAVNITSTLTLRVEATGEDTRVGRLMKTIADAASRKPPLVRFADRISGIFTWSMLGLSAFTFLLWLLRADLATALDHASALLIVTCPCALGLATPLVFTIAIGRAARHGVLIKGGDALQHLVNKDRRGTLFLDKTGTITHGRMSVVSYSGPEDLKPLIAAAERHSSHPIARALVAAFGDLPAPDPHEQFERLVVRQVTGGGLEVTAFELNREPLHLRIGSPAFVGGNAHGLDGLDPTLTPVLVSVNGEHAATIGLGDAIRADSPDSIRTLQSQGWDVQILSGDDPALVRSVGRALGLPDHACRGGLSPEDKLAIVRASTQETTTVMVGDGVNDAAALSAATVGIAVAGGAEASLAAADMYLQRPSLALLVDLTTAARRTIRTIHCCLCTSVFYNAIAGGLAVYGLINPIIAAFIMPVSSLTVLAVVYRRATFPVRATNSPTAPPPHPLDTTTPTATAARTADLIPV